MVPRTLTNSPIPAGRRSGDTHGPTRAQGIEGKSRVEPEPYPAHAAVVNPGPASKARYMTLRSVPETIKSLRALKQLEKPRILHAIRLILPSLNASSESASPNSKSNGSAPWRTSPATRLPADCLRNENQDALGTTMTVALESDGDKVSLTRSILPVRSFLAELRKKFHQHLAQSGRAFPL
jgi:hypothetical protein